MKTLYKSTRLIAAAVVGSLVLSAGAAVALTKDAQCEPQVTTATHYQDMGRFVVTPTKFRHTAQVALATTDLGRIVVTRTTAVFVPAA
jgi:hypothetical protein